MCKGTAELSRHYRGFLLKNQKPSSYVFIQTCKYLTVCRAFYLATFTSEETLLPNSSLLSEKQSQCFPHYFLFAAYLSPTVTAIWPAVRSETLREREREVCMCVCMRGLRRWVCYILTCLYSLERNQQHLVCKTTSVDREHLLCSAEKADSCKGQDLEMSGECISMCTLVFNLSFALGCH